MTQKYKNDFIAQYLSKENAQTVDRCSPESRSTTKLLVMKQD